MPAMLKEEVKEALKERVKELDMDVEDFLSKIADEKTATTEEEVMEFITANGHPVTTLDPMF
jgi:CO dehydrogenase/acetyl-CoA synthase beta subunit